MNLPSVAVVVLGLLAGGLALRPLGALLLERVPALASPATLAAAFLSCYVAIRLGAALLGPARSRAGVRDLCLLAVLLWIPMHGLADPFMATYSPLGATLCGLLGMLLAFRHAVRAEGGPGPAR